MFDTQPSPQHALIMLGPMTAAVSQTKTRCVLGLARDALALLWHTHTFGARCAVIDRQLLPPEINSWQTGCLDNTEKLSSRGRQRQRHVSFYKNTGEALGLFFLRMCGSSE